MSIEGRHLGPAPVVGTPSLDGMGHPCPEMLTVPGGAITLRDARTSTSREVDLEPFEVARAPVTRAQLGITDTDRSTADLPAHPVTWYQAVRWCNSLSTDRGLRPAYRITGQDVEWDVDSAGFRLPTEAEWEWACRARTTTPTYGPLDRVAWTRTDATDGPQPVGGKLANDFGLVDTLGNVWEWCWDYADPARYGEYRSLRGGGWADAPWHVRASVRRGTHPGAALEDVGFRVARGPVGEPGARAAQGWSADADERRAAVHPLPAGWTSLSGRRGPLLA